MMGNMSFDAVAVAHAAAAQASGEPIPWGEPDLLLVRQETTAAPELPLPIFPTAWARWIKEAAEGAGAPPAFVATALLAAAGAVIGNARWPSPWHPWKEPPAINVALVGRPSSGKSPALDQVQELIAILETETNEDWSQRQLEHKRATLETTERLKRYEADLKEAVRLGNAPPEMTEDHVAPEPIERRRLVSTDTTIEKAARLSKANPRGLLLIRDELAGWLGSMDRYANGAGGDRAFWLQAYGGRSWTTDRVKDADPVVIPHLVWSIIGTIQPDRAASLLMSGDDDGLAARILYCWPDPLPPRRPSCQADTEAALNRLRRLRNIPWDGEPEPKLVPFTEDAAAKLHMWRIEVAELESNAAGLMLSWLGKLPGMALRLALIFELLAWSEMSDGAPESEKIDEQAITAAITFLREFGIPMATRTFGAAALPQSERDSRVLARWLLQQRPFPAKINARDLRRRGDGPAIPDAERMEAALRELEAAGWCRPAHRSGGIGRARKDWEINPKLSNADPCGTPGCRNRSGRGAEVGLSD